MSKIQEALKKIQGDKRGDSPVPAERRAAAAVGRRQDSRPETHVSGDVLAAREPMSVDIEHLRNAGLLAPEQDSRVLASQMREIKRPLLANAFGKRAMKVVDGDLILVSSAVSGEGKSFISLNLALSISQEQDHSVILVDADVAKPHLSHVFGLMQQPGLLDLLDDHSLDVASAVIPTDLDGIAILPAGKPRHNSSELLASARMEEILKRLRALGPGRVVVFDGPPILQTAEAKILSSLIGQVALVVRADKTSQAEVRAAVDAIDESKPVNMILNQVRSSGQEPQYGYGYGYAQLDEDVDDDDTTKQQAANQ